MSNNSNLHKAKKAKNDEFFTQFSDIENELRHYSEHFQDKVVYCNCDDARQSNFVTFFQTNFDQLGLKKLIATGYRKNSRGIKLVYDSDHKDANIEQLQGDGDFRSEECVELLKQADIVVTNPPFSLFREYVAQLVGYGKKFLIIGSMNAITYKEIFPLIKANKIWIGVNCVKSFTEPDGKTTKIGNVVWFTNLDVKKRYEKLILTEKYDPAKYPKYDNYDAINVDKVNDIPKDYDGVMGVPITFFGKYNPEQFEIVQFRKGEDDKDLAFTVEKEREWCRTSGCSYGEFEKKFPLRWQVSGNERATVGGKLKYSRLFFRRRKPVGENAETPAV